MKRYTIGALFLPGFDKVLLILKSKPQWQEGKYNFPGGSVEEGETSAECIAREFKEETNLDISKTDWSYIGRIDNPDNYYVDFFTSIYYPSIHGEVKTMTDEKVKWIDCYNLPGNIISNLRWLIPFAKNIWHQGNADRLKFGTFNYSY